MNAFSDERSTYLLSDAIISEWARYCEKNNLGTTVSDFSDFLFKDFVPMLVKAYKLYDYRFVNPADSQKHGGGVYYES